MRKMIRVSFSIRQEQDEELNELSRLTGVPKSAFIRDALKYLIKKFHYLRSIPSSDIHKIFSHLVAQKIATESLPKDSFDQAIMRDIYKQTLETDPKSLLKRISRMTRMRERDRIE